MFYGASGASQPDDKPDEFPNPSSPSVRTLFDYIETRLWPKWNLHERKEFVEKRREQIVLNDRAGTLAQLLEEPFTCSIFEEPYSAVSVSIGIAIWGVESVKGRPAMWDFATEHASRMASLFDNHPKNYGKSFKNLETARHSTASSHRLMEIKPENVKKRPHDDSGSKASKVARNNEPEAVLSETIAAATGNGRVDEVVAHRPSRKSRTAVNYDESDTSNEMDADCELSHCSSECTELKTKLEAANEQLKKIIAETQAQKEDSETSLQQAEVSAKEQLAKVAEERDALQEALNNQARVGEEKLAKVESERDSFRNAIDHQRRATKEQLAKGFAEKDALQATLGNQRRIWKDQLAKVVAEKDSLRAALNSEVRARVNKKDMDKVMSDKATLQESLDTLREKYDHSLVLSFPVVAALKFILGDHSKTQLGHESTKIAQSLLGIVNDAYVRMLVSYSIETSQTTGSRKS